jgi:hypothetical protein
MGFSQSTILAVNPPVYLGFQVSLSWTTSSPAGTWFQVYLERQLSWWGQATSATIGMPIAGPVRVDIGTVLPGEGQTDFSGSLPSVSARRAELSWLGGTFEGADIAGFRVFGSDSARGYGQGGYGTGQFGDVDLGIVLADITAYPSGISTDGYGLGGYGNGGYGQSASTYYWTSDPLTRGSWTYAVLPYDAAGNLGTPAVTGITIVCPPLPPALYGDNTRLKYTYKPANQEATLNWNASPG